MVDAHARVDGVEVERQAQHRLRPDVGAFALAQAQTGARDAFRQAAGRMIAAVYDSKSVKFEVAPKCIKSARTCQAGRHLLEVLAAVDRDAQRLERVGALLERAQLLHALLDDAIVATALLDVRQRRAGLD